MLELSSVLEVQNQPSVQVLSLGRHIIHWPHYATAHDGLLVLSDMCCCAAWAWSRWRRCTTLCTRNGLRSWAHLSAQRTSRCSWTGPAWLSSAPPPQADLFKRLQR